MFIENEELEFSDLIKFHVLMMMKFENEEAEEILNCEMIEYLVMLDYTASEIKLLDYTLKKSADNTLIEVKANNLATGLWFCDVYPEKVPDASEESMIIDGIEYSLTKNGKIKKRRNAR
jgi:hypothetical protein